MLCSVLAESGLAGRPDEFLNARNIDAFVHARGPTTMGDMLLDYQSRRTSPNGYFGMKVHANQFKSLFRTEEDGAVLLRSFHRFILCTRRDKLNQAISYLLANERDVWHATATAVSAMPPRKFAPEDVGEIERHIGAANYEELYWRRTIAALKLPAVEVVFEDMVDRGRAEYSRVFSHLGIDLPERKIPAPATKPMPRPANEELRLGYLKAIGTRPT